MAAKTGSSSFRYMCIWRLILFILFLQYRNPAEAACQSCLVFAPFIHHPSKSSKAACGILCSWLQQSTPIANWKGLAIYHSSQRSVLTAMAFAAFAIRRNSAWHHQRHPSWLEEKEFDPFEGDKTVNSEEDMNKEEGSKGLDSNPLSSGMISALGFYKGFISPLLPPACRFVPTCSQYGVQAINEFGPGKGSILIAWRLMRCSPFGGKGFDPPRWPPVGYTYGSW